MIRRRARFAPFVALCLLCAALYLPGLGALPPVDRDEALYVQATRQMVASGDLVVPRVGDEPRLIKPAGIYWLQAASLRLASRLSPGGLTAYRLPGVLGALVAVLGTWLIGRRWLAPPAAVLGAALLAASALLVVEAHLATTDAVLLACVVAAQGCLAALLDATRHGTRGSARFAAGFWLAQGAGVLIKGPVAPLVSMLTVAALIVVGSARERAAGRRLVVALRPWWGIPLAAACLMPWLAVVGATLGWSALPRAMASDILPKLAGAHESHGGPPGLYLLLAPATFWPGSVAALFALGYAWKRRHRPAERFLLAWLVPVWVVFECLPTKLPHYVLPTFPALALLSGRAALAQAAHLWPPPRHWLVRAAFVGWALLAAAVGLALIAATWWLDAEVLVRLYAVCAAAVAIATAALCARWCWRVELGRAALAGIAGAVLFYALLLEAALPRLDGLWLARGVAAATTRLGTRPLLAVGYAEPSLMVLSAAPVRAADADGAAAELAIHPDRLALVSGDQVAVFAAAARVHGIALRHLETIEGVDYTHGRWLVLHVFEAQAGDM